MLIWAEQALTPEGWARDVRVAVGPDGRIASVHAGARPEGQRVSVLLPAPANAHSHAFQRAMAGLTERRGKTGDSFWTWRQLMYRFLAQLRPEDVQAIAAFVQMEMLEAGYATNVEFHYLHHQPDGTPYAELAEMSLRIAAAADQSGIGLTLLPVLYQYGGCDGRALTEGQLRFGNDPDRFARLCEAARAGLKPADWGFGIAPHSLRAVGRTGLEAAIALAPGGPIHMHLAEQTGEVDEVTAAWGARPVEWVLENLPIDRRWCLIHCTQMQPHETAALAATGAVAGLCPITESSLGDGIFDGVRWLSAGGRIAVGSDSNIRISLAEELRTLEYSQRLRDGGRAVLAAEDRSVGRNLFDLVTDGGARAAGRGAAGIVAGAWADLLALDGAHVDLEGRSGDTLLDTFVFAGGQGMVRDVWSAGRHMVCEGVHVRREPITQAYRETMARLSWTL